MNTPSPASILMLEGFEIGSRYDPRISWPGGASGLTIGCGYDLGYSSAARIGLDWFDLPAATVTRLKVYAGLTGTTAQAALAGTASIEVPEAIGRAVFEQIDIPRWIANTSAVFPHCDQLSGDSFGALVSLCFNRGTSIVGPTRTEMAQIRNAMGAGRPDLVPNLIRAMKRLWIGKGLDGLLLRRDAEAALFEEGLGMVAPVAGQPADNPSTCSKSNDLPVIDRPAPLTTEDLNDAEAARIGL